MITSRAWLLVVGTLAWLAVAPGALAAEAEGKGGNTNPLSVDPDLFLFTAVVFFLSLLFLQKFAWTPILEGLQAREDGWEANLAQAREQSQQAEARLGEYQRQLAAGAEQTRQVLGQARQQAETEGEQIVVEARTGARSQRDSALAEIAGAKAAALGEVSRKGSELALSLAGRIVKRPVSAANHAQLIEEALGDES